MQARDLVIKMMAKDKTSRISIENAYNHEYMKDEVVDDSFEENVIVNSTNY